MKIIDNKKDYYDYLVGEYGIDDLIVFDRRNSVTIQTDIEPKTAFDFLFSNVKSEKDIFQRTEKYPPSHLKGKKYGNFYDYWLKVGEISYRFEVERYLTDENTVKVETTLKYPKTEIEKKKQLERVRSHKTDKYWKSVDDLTLAIIISPKEFINLPILKNTPIPKFIPAKDIFLNIYSYLSSKKDIKIEDNRSDIMKLESAGFDKIESFRKIKHNATTRIKNQKKNCFLQTI